MQNSKKSKQNFDLLTFPQKGIIEFIYFPIAILIYLIYKTKKVVINDSLDGENEIYIILSLVALLHILASNVLSYLYNLQYAILPFNFAPRATPKRLKIIGIIVMVICVLKGVKEM